MRMPVQHMEISPHNRGVLSNVFGERVRNQGRRPHQGWDLAAPVGAPVFAVKDGIIAFTKIDLNGYGRQICLQFSPSADRPPTISGPDDLFAFYAHLDSIAVRTGSIVREGDIIGRVGRSGNVGTLPPHLHFEIRTEPQPGLGMRGRLDPGKVLGFETMSCRQTMMCPAWDM